MCSYMLNNKTAELLLKKIKTFLRMNGNCEIFQTDNGKEFNNQLLKIYLENNILSILEVCLIILNQMYDVNLPKEIKN